MLCLDYYCDRTGPYKTNKDWMSKLSNRKISELTVPGTHDSGCRSLIPWAKTQSYSITNQLEAGIRFLDIRCRHVNDTFLIYHEFINCDLTFTDVLQQIITFFEENPKEGILMRIRNEYKEENCSRSFIDTFLTYKQAYDIITYGLDLPMLDDIRGKIWLFSSFNLSNCYNFDWTDKQDDYNYDTLLSLGKKKDEIRQQAQKAISGDLNTQFVNFCSASGVLAMPWSVALETNKVIFEYTGRMGIVVFDFPGENLIQHLIDCNNL